MLDLYYAKVVDNNDPNKKGRIKIRIESLHNEISDESLLPWAKQFSLSTGGSKEYGTSCIPEKDSLVWVGFHDKKEFKKPYYVADIHLNEMHPHNLFEENTKSVLEGFESEYPDVKYTYLPNGICVGYTSGDSPEAFFVHPKASFYINKDGETLFKDENENEIKISSEGITLTAGSASLEATLLGETLKSKLESLIDYITQITVPTGVGPSGVPVNAAAFTALKAELSQILSQKIKNN